MARLITAARTKWFLEQLTCAAALCRTAFSAFVSLMLKGLVVVLGIINFCNTYQT
jgi:hypothetical protein